MRSSSKWSGAVAFNRFVERFDAWYESSQGARAYHLELECLRPLWPVGGVPRLEVGVGTGRFASVLGAEVGIDPAKEALRRAAARGVIAVQAAGERTPFGSRAFIGVLMVGVLCFADRPLLLLEEAKRVLDPSGVLLVGAVPLDSEWGALYLGKGRSGDPFYRSGRPITSDGLVEMVTSAGFRIEAARSTLLAPPGAAEAGGVEDGLVAGAGFVALLAAPA